MTDKDLKKLGQILDEKLSVSEQKIEAEVGKFIEEHIMAASEEKATSAEVARLQSSVDRFVDRVVTLENRVDKLEGKSSVAPPIA